MYPGIKSVDEKIWSMAKKKHVLIQQFENAKGIAIDCNLFKKRNVYKGDKPIKCYK